MKRSRSLGDIFTRKTSKRNKVENDEKESQIRFVSCNPVR